jgi:molybdenum ABC transporter molybdate-binding protein
MKYRTSRDSRTGEANNAVVLIVGSLVVIGGLSVFLFRLPDQAQVIPKVTADDVAGGNGKNSSKDDGQPNKNTGKRSLVLYCAAGMKLPVEAAATKFTAETGIEVQLQYGGSGTLLSSLQIAKTGDLYLAADTSYIEIAREKKVLSEAVALARMRPVIVVAKGNPKKIADIDDLLRSDVKFALADPGAASVGKLTKKLLGQSGQWDTVEKAAKVFVPTVNEITNNVLTASVDAGIIWDSQVNQHPDELDMVRIPTFDAAVKEVTIGVLKWCENSADALKFARYLQAAEKGQAEFEKFGFQTIPGDAWAEKPELILYSGGVNRLAIQDTIAWFEQREGVRVNVVYNGCGILVGMINGSQHKQPDAYFACDVSFMTQVQDRFRPALDVAHTNMVIITKRGNPKKINSAVDLAREGLKVGVANPKESALGALTQGLFETVKVGDSDLYTAMQPNISVRTPTADLLVNQLMLSLDAAVVYQANLSEVLGKVEIIPIREGNSTAIQPIAVGKQTKMPYLTQRLVDALTSDVSRKRFLDVGFSWRARLVAP